MLLAETTVLHPSVVKVLTAACEDTYYIAVLVDLCENPELELSSEELVEPGLRVVLIVEHHLLSIFLEAVPCEEEDDEVPLHRHFLLSFSELLRDLIDCSFDISLCRIVAEIVYILRLNSVLL